MFESQPHPVVIEIRPRRIPVTWRRVLLRTMHLELFDHRPGFFRLPGCVERMRKQYLQTLITRDPHDTLPQPPFGLVYPSLVDQQPAQFLVCDRGWPNGSESMSQMVAI